MTQIVSKGSANGLLSRCAAKTNSGERSEEDDTILANPLETGRFLSRHANWLFILNSVCVAQ